ncbi:hypothetical protein EVAR_43756_1 [Eumeta japonica]|uniref:Uncharacterized protein n=1 Tax=Eumeta variegata TaxID=151549 RepID=A0A4C1XHX4_EUMVA|nr:hypothetical protein EVAR_43756_1 [Eumeta japonica]
MTCDNIGLFCGVAGWWAAWAAGGEAARQLQPGAAVAAVAARAAPAARPPRRARRAGPQDLRAHTHQAQARRHHVSHTYTARRPKNTIDECRAAAFDCSMTFRLRVQWSHCMVLTNLD